MSENLYMIKYNNSSVFIHRVTNSVLVCFMPFMLFKVFELFVTVSATISKFIGVAFHVLFDVTFVCVFVGTPLLGTLDWRANVVYHMSHQFGFSKVFLVTSDCMRRIR